MAAGDPGVLKRNFSATAIETTLVNSISSAATGDTTTSVSVVSVSGFPSVPFTVILAPDTNKEEVVTVTVADSTTLTIVRGQDGTQAVSHTAGTSVRHGVSGRDFKEEQTHIAARGYDADTGILSNAGQTHVHGLQSGDGSVVGSTQLVTLTRKTLTTPTINGATLTGTVTSTAAIVVSGAGTITGLSSAGMSSSSAAPKSYVDAILVLQEASAASSATSASAAATSATSAATSASSAATSATAAATSASSASTSAGSSETSAIASATSASAAATSASSAATSAASAAAATSAAAVSASSAATSATSANASATAAATSATSAATSASSALTSQTAAATSATSAATSASSSLTSQTAAATSASSAATSASSVATIYDEFDDRYLGNKSSDPTVDNDGNPLLTGALYYNTVLSAMKVYSGSVWQLVAPDTSNFVDKASYTAKGVLLSATSASTPAALTVASTNGYVLSVNSSTATGLDWIAPNPGDITGVTAGTGLTGGGTSGDVTLNIANSYTDETKINAIMGVF
jgi:hypothetical protein